MATIKSYSDLQQSKKLAEILPLESADMCYLSDESLVPKVIYNGMAFFDSKEEILTNIIHCWSLTALLDVLPGIQGGKPIIALDDNYITYPHMSDLHTKADNIVDACVDMIEKLHELKLLRL